MDNYFLGIQYMQFNPNKIYFLFYWDEPFLPDSAEQNHINNEYTQNR